jgi:exodeoxyribonuclease V alpha subunit
MTTQTKSTLSIVSVTVDRVFSTSDTFSLFRAVRDEPIETRGKDFWRQMTCKAFVGPVAAGVRWTLAGAIEDDGRAGKDGRPYGPTFVAAFATPGVPRSSMELQHLLFTGSVEGWGWQAYQTLVDALGATLAFDACVKDHSLLTSVPGITGPMISSLREVMRRGAGLAAVYSQLAEWGLTGRMADKTIKAYGFQAAEKMEENPYRAIEDVYGYGWETAEKVARALMVPLDDPRRVRAGISLTVAETTWEGGHTWLTRHDATAGASALLGRAYSVVSAEVNAVIDHGTIRAEGDELQPAALYDAEYLIANHIAARLHRLGALTQEAVDALEQPEGISDEQWQAVCMALTTSIGLLTGGPGVGKTTALRTLVACAGSLGLPITLMAPTGKAASRMAEATGHPATTIHSRLGLKPGQYGHNPEKPPVFGLVVVDEVSMLDTTLAAQLLRGIDPSASLLLVGDPDQLPSVGPGAVLRDLLATDLLPRIHLDHVYRNEAGIAVNAARIRENQNIVDMADVTLFTVPTPERAQEVITALVGDLRDQGWLPGDILTLTPTNDRPSGRHALNRTLQALLNGGLPGTGITQYAGSNTDPDGTVRKIQEELRQGDRVMVTRNDPDLEVFNGQTGTITAITERKAILVAIDDRFVEFKGDNRRLLTLAYAVTGHKAQGSEAPIVIVPIFPSRVLSREWLYTVLTRARERVYLVGDMAAMQACLSIRRSQERKTLLVRRIRDLVDAYSEDFYEDSSPGDIEMFAQAEGQPVYHYRRQAAPWLTCCGLDTRQEGWEEVGPGTFRLCLHCMAASATPVYRIAGEVQA